MGLISKHDFQTCVAGLAIMFLTCPVSALGQTVQEYVSIAPPESWVEIQDVPPGEFEAASRLNIAYRLNSRQRRVGRTVDEYYFRSVMDLLTTGAVEDQGTISLEFDPAYQTMILHRVDVYRNGVKRDSLDLDRFDIFRSETDRDKLIFNGRLTISLNLLDLQAGDRLDYAFTRIGKNPGLGDGYFKTMTQNYSSPINRLYNAMTITDGLPIHVRTHYKAEAPERQTISDSVDRLVFSADNVAVFESDDDIPSWDYGYPLVELSSYDSWSDVGNVFAPYYAIRKSGSVQAIANTIRDAHDTPATQARAALDYVQRNIRYFGIEMGEGGFRPRDPELVLERRFGDCKDVTLLLLTLLDELGIEAAPLLVDTKERAGVFDSLPNHTAFDHIVVKAVIADRDYVMDATRSPQLGDLEHYAQGAFVKGLLLREGASKVVDLPEALPSWLKDYEDSYDLITDPDAVTFTNTLTTYGDEADVTLDWINEDGLASVEKSLLDYFRDLYPTIMVAEETEFTQDEARAKVALTTVFTIPDAWADDTENNRRTFDTRPYEINADMPGFSGADRRSAFALEFPNRTRQTVEIIVDKTYSFDDDEFSHTSEAFEYTETDKWDETAGIYTEVYGYRTKLDHIPLEDVKVDMGRISEAYDRRGMTVQKPLDALRQSATSTSSVSPLWRYPVYIILALMIAGVARLVSRRKSVPSST